MSDPTPRDLIERYFHSDLSPSEARDLNAALRNDPASVDALVDASFDLQHLRERLSAELIEADASISVRPQANRSWPRGAAVAAMLLLAAIGWSMAWFGRDALTRSEGDVARLTQEVNQLRAAATAPTTTQTTTSHEPVTVTRRGLLLALQEGAAPTQSIQVGYAAPLGRRIWTCPWGAAEFRYADGVSLAVDRSTIAVLAEDAEDDAHVIRVDTGLIHVTGSPTKPDAGLTIINTPHARIRLTNAQVAVDVKADRTIVEVAVGEVVVDSVAQGEAAVSERVQHGYFAEISAARHIKVARGQLRWSVVPTVGSGPAD